MQSQMLLYTVEKYTLKWLKTILFRQDVQFWPFLENATSGIQKRCIDLNSVAIYSSYYKVTP